MIMDKIKLSGFIVLAFVVVTREEVSNLLLYDAVLEDESGQDATTTRSFFGFSVTHPCRFPLPMLHQVG